MRHITPQGMAEHGTYPGVQGAKNGFFMAGLLQVKPAHIRKCSRLYCPITSQRIRLIKPHKYTANFNQTSQKYSKLFSSNCKLFCIFPEIEGFKNHWDPQNSHFDPQNSHFWTPGTLDRCLEWAKEGLSHALPCIGL